MPRYKKVEEEDDRVNDDGQRVMPGVTTDEERRKLEQEEHERRTKHWVVEYGRQVHDRTVAIMERQDHTILTILLHFLDCLDYLEENSEQIGKISYSMLNTAKGEMIWKFNTTRNMFENHESFTIKKEQVEGTYPAYLPPVEDSQI